MHCLSIRCACISNVEKEKSMHSIVLLHWKSFILLFWWWYSEKFFHYYSNSFILFVWSIRKHSVVVVVLGLMHSFSLISSFIDVQFSFRHLFIPVVAFLSIFIHCCNVGPVVLLFSIPSTTFHLEKVFSPFSPTLLFCSFRVYIQYSGRKFTVVLIPFVEVHLMMTPFKLGTTFIRDDTFYIHSKNTSSTILHWKNFIRRRCIYIVFISILFHCYFWLKNTLADYWLISLYNVIVILHYSRKITIIVGFITTIVYCILFFVLFYYLNGCCVFACILYSFCLHLMSQCVYSAYYSLCVIN